MLTTTLRFALITCLAAVSTFGIVACDDDTAADGTPIVTEDNYVVPRNELATPLNDTSTIMVDSRMAGIRLTGSIASLLTLSDEKPRKVIEGKQVFEKEQWTKFITSRDLRIENIQAPSGAAIVQVDVSRGTPTELKSVPTNDRARFVAAPVLHDDIGNVYWPVGYLLKDLDNQILTIHLDLADHFRDLNRLPPLSRSKRQDLRLVYQVNLGVTLTGISYGGYERRSFNIPVTQ